MEQLFYTIGEVAEILDVKTSTVRFWSDTFSKYVKPRRNLKGNRLYQKGDVEFLKELHYLVKIKGLTLEGASKVIAGGRKKISANVKVLDTLKDIRQQLNDVKQSL